MTAHAFAQSVAPTVLPSGGRVIGGAATIGRSGSTLTIEQSTPEAAIDWQSFSVGSRASVGFHVPSAQATTINRVVGPDPSVIAGRITSNGNVVIANQSGIVFTRGAEVDVNALVASAPGISAANAVAGKLVFDQPARAGARVVNEGAITVRQAGLAALVGPSVANSGVISARLGRVVLGGAAAATVDFYGDGLLSFDVTKQVRPTAHGGLALVTNTGTIVADGGTVTLSAAAVDGLVTNLVDAGGRIAAASVGGRTGRIVIEGTGGSVVVSGSLQARGEAAGTTGGAIGVDATGSVTVAPGAVLDVSGAAGGGVIAVGTSLARAAGGASVAAPQAAAVTVAQGATLAADASASGDGGRVALLSSGLTDFAGYARARGGPSGGQGGAIEISG
ncbi:MAG: filamentous hemagglutinin N-terminal domain-containing protein, partial [Rhodospirillales bacterium]|nr:filamentous hemagglutinin N-terminal domain-containing protein [Rhodospirillales bacterium]